MSSWPNSAIIKLINRNTEVLYGTIWPTVDNEATF